MKSSIAKNVNEPRSYAFTYNRNYKKSDDMKESDYDIVLELLGRYGKVQTYTFEVGKQKRLHIHGVVDLHPKYVYPRFLRLPGFVYKVDEIYDYAGWVQYIRKEQTKEIVKPLVGRIIPKEDYVPNEQDDKDWAEWKHDTLIQLHGSNYDEKLNSEYFYEDIEIPDECEIPQKRII